MLILPIGFLIFFSINPLYATLKVEGHPIDIEANVLEYNQSTGTISASGNVHVEYKGYKIDTSSFLYDAPKRELHLGPRFKVTELNNSMEGTTFHSNRRCRKRDFEARQDDREWQKNANRKGKNRN